MRFKIQWRFLIKFGVLLLVVGTAVFFTHRVQSRKQAGAFLRHADHARDLADQEDQAGNTSRAVAEREREEAFLRRYLASNGNDIDTRERFARLKCRTATTVKQSLEAHFVLEDVLLRDPGRDGLRRFAAEFAMNPKLRMYKEAQGHLKNLLEKKPEDGELEGLIARCLVADRKFDGGDGAKHFYEQSVKHKSDLIDSHAGLVAVLVHLKKLDEAKTAVIKMLKENPSNYRAHLVAASYWREFGTPQQVEESVAKARELAPDKLEVLLASANVALVKSRTLARDRKKEEADQATDEARQFLARATEGIHAKVPEGYMALAALEGQVGKVEDALKAIRKGLEQLPESAELTLGLMEYQFRAPDAVGAAETLKKLRDRGLSREVGDYEQARLLILQEKWQAAALALELVIPDFADRPYLARQANLLLGRCYEQMGENERRLEAFTRVLSLPTPLPVTDPLWIPATLGLAESQAALGQAEESIKTYRKMTDWVPGVWVQVGRLELIRALQSFGEKPDWSAAEEAVTMAEKAVTAKIIPDLTEIRLLRAGLLHYRGNAVEARKRLEVLRSERPKEIAVWVELAMQDMREKNHKQALATLAAAEKEVGDSPSLRLARARLWAEAKEPDLDSKISTLATGAERFGPAQRLMLLRGLAEVATAAGSAELSSRLWTDLARARPFDLGVQLIQFDRALRAGDAVAMDQALAKITEIDGEGGQSTRLTRAVKLIHESMAASDRGKREKALELLNDLERQGVKPPISSRVANSQALIYDLIGNPDAARVKYQKAIELGESNPQVLRRLMELYTANRQYSEALAVLSRLPAATASGADVQRLAAEVSLQTDKRADAIGFATRAVPENSTNYQDQIWLGRIYWSGGNRIKPEAMFRKATELRPDASDAWLILIQYLAETGRKDEALKILDQAKDKVKKADQALFLAAGYTQLGQTEKAAEAYKQAQSDSPSDLRAMMSEADFLLQVGRLSEARKAFKRVLAHPSITADSRAFATQRLALATAADPEYTTSREALALLSSIPEEGQTPAQKRSRAVILAVQNDRATKLEAIRLLEENAVGRSPAEQFMLAQLYSQVGNRPRVRVVMADLLKPENNRIPLYVGFHTMLLLREGDISEAEGWVRHLIKTDPDSLQTAELKARIAMVKKDPEAARAALIPKANNPDAPLGLIARICEDIGLYDDAERLLKKFVDQKRESQPNIVLATAAYYGRRGRTTEGLRICEDALAKAPAPAVCAVAVGVLYNSTTPISSDLAKVAGWIEAALAKAQNPDRAALIQQLASVKNIQGDYATSASLYRQAIELNSRDVMAMNNLAYLLSAQENKHDDALGWIEKAKGIVGQSAVLLDTEALVLLKKGDAANALKLLEVVVAETPSGSAYFHLAQAELALKHDAETRRAWRRALELGLKPSDLHPLERPTYESFRSRLN